MLLVSGECRPALLLYRLYLASLKLCAGGSRQCVGLCRSGYIDQRVSDCACRFGRTPSVIDHGHAAAAEYGCRRSLHAWTTCLCDLEWCRDVLALHHRTHRL